MLILKELQLLNFLSHSKTIIKFKKNQQILLDGKSGSGKSSITESLIWVLYNRGRSDSKSLIKKGATKTSVTVILVDNEDPKISYSITRNITNKGKHDFDILQKEGKVFKPLKVSGLKNTQEYLEQKILHSSYLLFVNSICYPQNNIESFVFQTAEKKKDILLEIIGAAQYDEYLKKAKEKFSEQKLLKTVAETSIDSTNYFINNDKKPASHLKEYENEDKKLQEEIKIVESKIKELEEKKIEYVEKKALLEGKKDKSLELTKTIIEKKEKLEELNEKYIELSNIDITLLEKKVEQLNKVKEQLKEIETERDEYIKWNTETTKLIQQAPVNTGYDKTIEKLNEKIIGIMNEEIEICPEIKKKCPILEDKQRELIESTQKELKDATTAHNAYQEASKEHIVRLDAMGTKQPVSNNLLDNLRSSIINLEPFKKQLIEAKSKEEIIKQIGKELGKIKSEINVLLEGKAKQDREISEEMEEVKKSVKINDDIIIYTDQKNELQIKQTHNDGLLTGAQLAEKRIKELEEKLKELKKEFGKVSGNIDSLELIKGAFGPNGIRAIMIDYVIPQLEDKINDILAKLSDFRVRLDTQKSGIDKEIVLEGMFINVINEQGEESDFSNFSGGERIKIITAVSEALSEIQQMGFRIIDELFVGLDDESIDSFVQVMLTLQERFSQLICISHIDRIKELFEDKIMVTKVNGNSLIN